MMNNRIPNEDFWGYFLSHQKEKKGGGDLKWAGGRTEM
jgi:hypothetical protein